MKPDGDKTSFGRKLHHSVPNWVDLNGAIFHIRIRSVSVLTGLPETARALLDSVEFYHARDIWWPGLFLLMPDHLHALIHFHPDRSMSRVVGDWKKWHNQNTGITWQEGYFDHRLRSNESQEEKTNYIRNNPVVAGLCDTPEDWPWWLSFSVSDGGIIKGYESE